MTRRRRTTAVVAAVVLAATVTVRATAPVAAVPVPTGNAVTRWMANAFAAVRSGQPAVHTATPGAARTYALTTGAMYDAVNGIDVADGTSTRTAAIVGPSGAPAGADRSVAAGAAAHAVLSSLFPGRAAVLDEALAAEVAAAGSGPAVAAGRAWGADIGARALAVRADDGTQAAGSKPGGTAAGAFPRLFTGTQFRSMRTFGISSIAPFRSPGPPALTSDRYAEDLAEVRALGGATDTDPVRTAISRHWLAEGGTVRETGLWLKAALDVVQRQGTVASLSDTARLFALLGLGIADAVVVSWNDKFDHHLWRPGDAIRQLDPTWNPRTGTPCPTGAPISSCSGFGGTPEHTSGTSTFAGAASTVLAAFYCTDKVPFALTGEQPGAPERTYDSFSAAAREAGRSRIFGGIHFQFSNELGRESGKGIGREVATTRLQPVGAPATCGRR